MPLKTFILLALPFILNSCVALAPPATPEPTPPPIPDTTPRFTVHQELYDAMPSGSGRIEISLAQQSLTLFNSSDQPVIETDCSTGMEGRATPTGHFRILEMIIDKRSNKYGKYVSKETGEVVVEKSWEVAKRPAGTKYLGIPMPYWMRLTWYGVGIHVGHFPRGQRSSFGCIRMPEAVQPLIYQKCRKGTRVHIQ